MYYKEDWAEARERFEAFWNQEIIDRPCIGITAPRKGGRLETNTYDYIKHSPVSPAPEANDDVRKWWMDPELTLKRHLDIFANTFYGGEAFPVTEINLGASIMAAFFGSPPEFRPETVWYPEIIRDWVADKLEFDPATNPFYQMVIENTCYYVQESKGRYFVGHTELGTAMDILSLLRGMQNLCYDMIDQPNIVKEAIGLLAETWVQVHEEIYALVKECNDGGSCLAWMQTWAPGRHAQMACDYSAIMSPAMFADFAIPELDSYIKWNDFATYHWDGPDAIKHLDALLEISGIDVIQWTSGAGQSRQSSPQWIPLYQKIQAAGKGLYLYCSIDEVETLLSNLSARGLFIRTWASSEDEARNLLRMVGKWTRG